MKGMEIVNRFNALRANRSELDTQLQDIQRYVVPFRGEFFNDVSHEQSQDWQRVNYYDPTAGISVNLLASQMMGNVTSPVTKWFSFSFRNEDLKNSQPAMEWLEKGENKTWETIRESNFDTTGPEVYLDMGSFGTSVCTMEDVDDLVWKGVTFNAQPLMDSYFESGPDGLPYRVYRELRYTYIELNDTFDLPDSLKQKDQEATDVSQKHLVIYCVYKEPKNKPQDGIVPGKLRPVQFRYVHYETGKLLKKKGMKADEGGFYDFPGMTIRWQKVAGARWGFSPAIKMLSNIRSLNTKQFMMDEAWAKAIDPPMKATELAVLGDLDNIPGGLTITTDVNELQPLYPATNFSVGYEGIERSQDMIRQGFFTDKLELPNQRQMTAYEVQVRYERMLRLLAPTLGRLKTDFLMPVVTGIFNRLLRMGQLDEMPEELTDAELDVEFTGPLPRAMKGEVSDGMQRWLLGVMEQVEINPDSLDLVDFDEYNRTNGIMLGVPVKILRSDEEVEAIRKDRAEQQAAAQETEQIRLGGEAAEQAGKGAMAVQEAGMEVPE